MISSNLIFILFFLFHFSLCHTPIYLLLFHFSLIITDSFVEMCPFPPYYRTMSALQLLITKYDDLITKSLMLTYCRITQIIVIVVMDIILSVANDVSINDDNIVSEVY